LKYGGLPFIKSWRGNPPERRGCQWLHMKIFLHIPLC
jgi:hypothetical protein